MTPPPASSCARCHRLATPSADQTTNSNSYQALKRVRFNCDACDTTWTTTREDADLLGAFLHRSGIALKWHLSHRFDPRACALADRHYSRRTVGSNQMMPSGRTLVLVTESGNAVWGTSFQVAADGTLMAFHAWPLAWNCSIFRNESEHLSSELIREAIAATRHAWGEPPPQGFVTFVDASRVRRKRDPGRCYLKAGFRNSGATLSGKVALVLHPDDFPDAEPAISSPGSLFDAPRALDPSRRRTAPGKPIEES